MPSLGYSTWLDYSKILFADLYNLLRFTILWLHFPLGPNILLGISRIKYAGHVDINMQTTNMHRVLVKITWKSFWTRRRS
jgi:hypothetical protein